MRIAANTTTDLTSATAANLSLLGGVSPFNSGVGSYVLVPAGSTPIALSSGTGIGTCASPITTLHGEDLTLLVTAATCTVLTDDNTRPPGSFAKLRLVNGVNGGGIISLEDNSVLIAPNVPSGEASIPTTNDNQGLVSSGSLSNLTVSPTTPAFSAPNVTLLSGGVYSLFMLGSSSATTGVLTHDH
jgi:tetrahydromethanopterin S-methyltransferase subunit D